MGITKNHIHTENQIALAQLFKALAHPARIAIIENLLLNEDLNCKGLGKSIQLAQSTISRHIKELHDVGVLDVKVIGNNAYYQVNSDALAQVTQCLDEIRKNLETKRIDKLFKYSKHFEKITFPYFRDPTRTELSPHSAGA